MTVYSWHAFCADVLEAEGQRRDHKGTSEALASEVGAELRAAGVPVTVVAVRELVGSPRTAVGADRGGLPAQPDRDLCRVGWPLSRPCRSWDLFVFHFLAADQRLPVVLFYASTVLALSGVALALAVLRRP